MDPRPDRSKTGRTHRRVDWRRQNTGVLTCISVFVAGFIPPSHKPLFLFRISMPVPKSPSPKTQSMLSISLPAPCHSALSKSSVQSRHRGTRGAWRNCLHRLRDSFFDYRARTRSGAGWELPFLRLCNPGFYRKVGRCHGLYKLGFWVNVQPPPKQPYLTQLCGSDFKRFRTLLAGGPRAMLRASNVKRCFLCSARD